MSPNSIVGSIYMIWEEKLGHLILKGIIQENTLRETVYDNVLFEHFLYKKIEQIEKDMGLQEHWCQNTPNKNEHVPCVQPLVLAFEQAITELNQLFGENYNEWQWHRVSAKVLPQLPFSKTPLRNIFERKSINGGNRRTINVGSFYMRQARDYMSTQASNLRFLVELDEKSYPLFMLDSGQSGNVFSKHYDDMLRMHEKGEYIEVVTGQDALKNLTNKIVLRN
eukprot:TRINITY_DN663_c0_g1_i12.p1 TRINITY_DN663_c0_g1~~TRINITY_DN663_c0_g1_i12.p1  ORF type:complete len:223 (+),score=28.54 TRINITY_DN663_c0_g1_i12:173-841(+)